MAISNEFFQAVICAALSLERKPKKPLLEYIEEDALNNGLFIGGMTKEGVIVQSPHQLYEELEKRGYCFKSQEDFYDAYFLSYSLIQSTYGSIL